MDFRNLTVKELFDNPDPAAVIKELAPQLLKYPIKLLGKKKCGEIFDKVVATGIVPKVIAKETEARINKILASRYIANRYPRRRYYSKIRTPQDSYSTSLPSV